MFFHTDDLVLKLNRDSDLSFLTQIEINLEALLEYAMRRPILPSPAHRERTLVVHLLAGGRHNGH